MPTPGTDWLFDTGASSYMASNSALAISTHSTPPPPSLVTTVSLPINPLRSSTHDLVTLVPLLCAIC
uniref:Uncharacterized protein n=1 Tax=Arundo donax TaxID=35708 RepID=A0A0A9BZ78_ARUDO